MLRKVFDRDIKIKNKIFFITLLLLLVFSLIGIITFNYFSNLYEKRIYEEAAEVLKITSTILDEEINKVEKLSFQIATDDFIQRDLQSINENKYSYEMYRIKAALIKRLESIVNSEQYITSIQIEDSNNIKYTAGYQTKIYQDQNKNDLEEISQAQGANIWFNLGEKNLLTSSRLMRNKQNLDLTLLGVLNITIDLYRLIDSNVNFSPHKNFIIKRNNELIYSKNDGISINDHKYARKKSGYDVARIEDNDYLIAYTQSRHSDLTYYNILPYEYISQQTKYYKILMIFVFLVMLILTILLSYRSAKGISEPLERLTRKIKQAQHTNPNVNHAGHSHNEIEDLSENFHTMLQKIDELNRKNYEKQIIIKETEYKALQAQINPHFLYNTLDSINWLAQMNDQSKIAKMTEALGNMMRNILSKKAPLISLREELEIVKSYMTIQQHRYYDRLTFSINTTSRYEDSSIPKLSIQPIVENAIQHGLEEMAKPCHINISISVKHTFLEILVEDNGQGMSKTTIDAIFNNTVKKKSTGIGLFNISERIRLMFGPEYGLEIDSMPGKGTKIKIKLPFTGG